MKMSTNDLTELIAVVFVDVYQFVAYREHQRLAANVNVTSISDAHYNLIWKLAGYDGVPQRSNDRRVVGDEWEVYVDDEFIDSARIALQSAWQASQSRKCPTRLLKSNREIKKVFGPVDGQRDWWEDAVEKFNGDEQKWRRAIRQEKKVPSYTKPTYVVYISKYEVDKCIALSKSGTRLPFSIPSKAENHRALWRAIFEQCVHSGVVSPSCELSIAEVRTALGRSPNDQSSVRTQVSRFNDLWKKETEVPANVLVLSKGVYKFQPLIYVSEDADEAIQNQRLRLSKKSP